MWGNAEEVRTISLSIRRARCVGKCWRNIDVLIVFLLCIFIYVHLMFGRQEKNFFWLCTDTACRLDDVHKAMVDVVGPWRHCWRSKDELVSDVLLWTPSYGQAKAGRPARTYIQKLCEDTGCNPEDLPEAMNDREKWRELVRDIRAGGTTWWWWWYIYICIYIFR